MSVASRNPFALLGEDGEPAAAVPIKKNDPTSLPSGGRTQREIPGSGSRGNASRGAAGGRGGGRNVGFANNISADADANAENRDVRSAGRGRVAGRGRGRGRGGRGREFDRHSQTARVDSEKAVAQGWGGDDAGRELDAEKKAAEDAANEETSGAVTPAEGEAKENGGASAATAAAPAAAGAAPEPEEVDNTKTYDEYLAEQAERKAKIGGSSQAPRSADEWKEGGKKVEKRSEEEDSYIAGSIKAKQAQSQRERKEKNVLEIDTYFEAPSTGGGDRGARGGRGGRGSRGGNSTRGESRGRGGPGGASGPGGFGGASGRGGPRGGRGGSAGRGGRGGNNSVNLDDNRAFPSLGA